MGTGEADCHSQCAHWLRNDMVFHGVRCAAGHMGPALQGPLRGLRADRSVRPYAKQGDANKHVGAG